MQLRHRKFEGVKREILGLFCKSLRELGRERLSIILPTDVSVSVTALLFNPILITIRHPISDHILVSKQTPDKYEYSGSDRLLLQHSHLFNKQPHQARRAVLHVHLI